MTLTEPAVDARIHARRVRFDWDGTPLHWVPEDPQTTHTINVLHLLLPAGERWFVDVYRQVLPLITDERLREDVKGFMGQEATHSRAHAAVLEHLDAQGIDPAPYTKLVDWGFDRLGADDPLGLRLPRVLRRRWLLRRLAVIAAIEHFTAVLGTWIIDASAGLDEAGCDATMLDLLRWHGAEEVEHRSVAFDVYQHLSGSYVGRATAMLGAFVGLFTMWVRGVRFFMRADPSHPGRPTWRAFRRAGRRGRLPTMEALTSAVPRYLRRDYHPSQEGSTERARQYLKSSPAAAAL